MSTFYRELGIGGRTTILIAAICFFLQFISRPYLDSPSNYLFGGLGGLFLFLAILFYYTSKEKHIDISSNRSIGTTTEKLSTKAIKPIIAGIILAIVGCFLTYVFLSMAIAMITEIQMYSADNWHSIVILKTESLTISVIFSIFSIVTVLGGIASILKRLWGLAVSGCILGLIPISVMIIASTRFSSFSLSALSFTGALSLVIAMILIFISKKEFDSYKPLELRAMADPMLSASSQGSLAYETDKEKKIKAKLSSAIEESALDDKTKEIMLTNLSKLRAKSYWDEERTVGNKKISISTLTVEEGKFLELYIKSDKEFNFSFVIRNKKAGSFKHTRDIIYSFWPFIDSPTIDTKETIWTKDIKQISKIDGELDQFMIFSNKPDLAKTILLKTSKFTADFDLFYLSQNYFYAYDKIANELDRYKIDSYVKSFIGMINAIEDTH